jgi:penicillin-binding protein 1A
MGIKSKVEPYPASALGTADISLYEMVGAYATFANKGIWTKPIYLTRIVDKNGNIIFENLPVTKEALSEQTAYVMCKMLEQTTTSGTAAKIKYEYKIPGACGGKTGTTQNYSDAWFMGITPTLVSGLWVGWEDRAIHFRTMNLGSGGSLAMPFWAEYMKRVTAKPGLINIVDQWPAPQNPLTLEINCEKFEEEAPEKLDFMEGE